MIDLVEFTKHLESLKREHLVITEGGEEFIYNPATREYKRIAPMLLEPARTRNVSNAEALLLVVLEEARRRGNETGNHMTVIFDKSGGEFHPDDTNRKNPDKWVFGRKTSNQMSYLTHVLGTTFDHTGLLRAMSQIRYSVINFGEIYSAMRQVRVDKKASFNSQPRLENGKTGCELSFQFTIEGDAAGVQKAKFPAEFSCELPLISMSAKKYKVDVEVEAWADEKALKFALRSPGIDSMYTQAILEEIAQFTADAKKALPDLLIVTDL